MTAVGFNCCKLHAENQLRRSVLVAGNIATADQHGAVDLCPYVIKLFANPLGIGSTEGLAGDALVLVRNYALGKVHESAILDAAGKQVAFDTVQLLSPVGVRVAE